MIFFFQFNLTFYDTHTHTHTHFCSYGRCSFLNAENSLNTLFDIIPAMKGLILAAVVT